MSAKRKPGRPAGSGIYTVRRQIVLDPELAKEWREMVKELGVQLMYPVLKEGVLASL